MRLFLDTNIFIAALEGEQERGETAKDLLNSESPVFYTSLLNLMEIRTVLIKKKQREADAVRETIARISDDVKVVIPDMSDFIDGYRLQDETLLYPLDVLILSLALTHDATLVTFDGELLDHADEYDVVSPESLLD